MNYEDFQAYMQATEKFLKSLKREDGVIGVDHYRKDINKKQEEITSAKYFTPSIEDLCIGYECEINNARGYKDDFEATVIGYKILGGYTNELSDIIAMVDDGYGEIRVPYLTKEQIIEEGWNWVGSVTFSNGEIQTFSKGGINLHYNTNSHNLEIDSSQRYNLLRRFDGDCKDINTFRKICKLLNI